MRYHEIIGEAADLDEEIVNEGPRGLNSWYILPCTMILYGKRTVDIITAASTWEPCVIYVCSKEENGKKRILFVSSAAAEKIDTSMIGKSYDVFHDQNQSYKGVYTVENLVRIENGQITDKINDIGIRIKASIATLK